MFAFKVPPWVASIVIEPYMFLMSLTMGFSLIPMDQLFQDKICRLEFNQTIEYCLKMSGSETSDIKLGILTRLNTLNQYKAITDTIPSVLWVLIVGSVCDKFPRTRKPFMISCICSGLARDIILLLNLVYFNEWGTTMLILSASLPSFIGSFWGGFTLALSYVAIHSNESNRVIRFLTADASLYAAFATGSLVSSQVLKQKSWIGGSEIRNFSGIYILGIFASILCFTWTYFRVNFKPSSPKIAMVVINNNEEEEIVNDDSKPILVPKVSLWREVFNLKHVISSFQTVIRKRDTPGVRTQILLLMIALIAIMMEKMGMTRIMFPFVQRQYKWNFEIYSYNSVVSSISGPLMTLMILPFLSKVCKFADMQIAIVGVVSLMLSTLCIGSILSPTGYYLALSLGSLSNSAAVSIRAKLSKLIPHDEVTQIFSATTTIEVLCPLISAVVYTNIANLTMKYYPTLIMQISCMILFLPLIHFIIVDLKYWKQIPQ